MSSLAGLVGVWRIRRAGRLRISYSPAAGFHGKADDLATWANREMAEYYTPSLVNGHAAGGIGVVLGGLGGGDLDFDLENTLTASAFIGDRDVRGSQYAPPASPRHLDRRFELGETP